MAEHLTLQQINSELKNSNFNTSNAFVLLQSIAAKVHKENDYLLQEVILRVLEKRDLFIGYKTIINDLARAIGLFPYLKFEELNLADKIAYEFHKPGGIEQENIVFHRLQAKVYFDLLDGKNIILSAPTSFGKSLIIDTIIASGKFKNVAIILPTLALIDETRKRLSKFRNAYKLITHSTQKIQEKIFLCSRRKE